MLSYTNLLSIYQDFTNNTTSLNQTNGAIYINQAVRDICNKRNWSFLEDTLTDVTVASTQEYLLPYNLKKLINCSITVSSTKWTPIEINNKTDWDNLNATANYSDQVDNFYIYAGKINFYPIPSTSDNVIRYNYIKAIRDVSVADYTTGTVTMTNASKTVTGSGTTFTALMVGRYIKATNDGYWYKISAFVSATELTLEKVFQGTTAGSLSYIIGEMTVLPEGYEMLAIYKSAIYYFTGKDQEKVTRFTDLYKELYQDLEREYGSKTTSVVLEDDDYSFNNPNLYITA